METSVIGMYFAPEVVPDVFAKYNGFAIFAFCLNAKSVKEQAQLYQKIINVL